MMSSDVVASLLDLGVIPSVWMDDARSAEWRRSIWSSSA